ncbi:hypothetical protein JR316_0000230 [Psilocybe cubensis]|uniref:Uncharacterized protein n=2 Tax=Psilocybe cubensis TaxID=181762 RepID=A0A8H7Y933_PSICU|nr:hypothetical protein JR316_0000230 [Psilocybe cubensis]KAH9486166.1 hypothetical protein JR316_0000230 [Psilocybe cubensis]
MEDIFLKDCTATFKLAPSYGCDGRLYHLSGRANHPQHGEIAFIVGYAIKNRQHWLDYGDFMQIMEGENSDLRKLTHDVFNNSLELYPWLYDGTRRSGTGVWGEELNRGNILLIEIIRVDEKFIRKGVGSWLLKKFLNSPHCTSAQINRQKPQKFDEDPLVRQMQEAIQRYPVFARPQRPVPHAHIFCLPGTIGRKFVTEDDIIAFFRKNGFRRVGRTQFLCYSSDPDHPSHNLALAEDPLYLAQEFPEEPAPDTVDLHATIAKKDLPNIADAIRKQHSIDPTSIHQKNIVGFTPTHVAALSRNRNALEALLELGVQDDLKLTDNKLGATPLEALEESMCLYRATKEHVWNTWKGYPSADLRCQFLLKKALNMPFSAATEEEYSAKYRLGCTCGQCSQGWLSRRMRYRLAVTANDLYDTPHELFEMGCASAKESGKPFNLQDFSFSTDLAHIPPVMHSKMDEEFCRLWLKLFQTIYVQLKKTDGMMIPTPAQLSQFPIARALIGKGAKVEYALDLLTNTARDQSPFGDGTFDEMGLEDYDKLPRCDNDLAFGFVREKLGLDPRLQWGPYSSIASCMGGSYLENLGLDAERAECFERLLNMGDKDTLGDDEDEDDEDEDDEMEEDDDDDDDE